MQTQLLVEHYTQRLLALAQVRLDPRLRRKLDPGDIVQSVFRTFFRRAARGDFILDNEDNLWALLVRITLRKCSAQAEHFLAARRDVRREVMAGIDFQGENRSSEPTPEEAAALQETLEWLRSQLSSERKRKILELSLEGYGVVEISEKVGYYERGVERVRAEIRELLLQLR